MNIKNVCLMMIFSLMAFTVQAMDLGSRVTHLDRLYMGLRSLSNEESQRIANETIATLDIDQTRTSLESQGFLKINDTQVITNDQIRRIMLVSTTPEVLKLQAIVYLTERENNKSEAEAVRSALSATSNWIQNEVAQILKETQTSA